MPQTGSLMVDRNSCEEVNYWDLKIVVSYFLEFFLHHCRCCIMSQNASIGPLFDNLSLLPEMLRDTKVGKCIYVLGMYKTLSFKYAVFFVYCKLISLL